MRNFIDRYKRSGSKRSYAKRLRSNSIMYDHAAKPPLKWWQLALAACGAIIVVLLVLLGASYGSVKSDSSSSKDSKTATTDVKKDKDNKNVVNKDAEQSNTNSDTNQSNSPSGNSTVNPPAVSPNTTTQPAALDNHTNPDYAKLQKCTVGRVSDGDTLYVDCLPQRIRMIGVDTPESTNKHQCFGNEASAHTKALRGQTVYLESDDVSGDTDTYGRYLRYIYLADGTNYNMQLIEDGYGMLYIFSGQQFKYVSQFSGGQDAARGAGKGLWSACQTGVNKYGNYQVTN